MTTKYLNLYFITPNIVQITVCMNWKWQGVESRALSITAEAGCSVDALLHRKGSHVGALVGTWTHLLRQDLSERTTASYSKEIAGVCRTGRAKANRKPPSGRQGSADALSWELVCSFTKGNNIHYLGALAITHMKKGRWICVHACVHMCPCTLRIHSFFPLHFLDTLSCGFTLKAPVSLDVYFPLSQGCPIQPEWQLDS